MYNLTYVLITYVLMNRVENLPERGSYLRFKLQKEGF